jgi:hypothetical protein
LNGTELMGHSVVQDNKKWRAFVNKITFHKKLIIF